MAVVQEALSKCRPGLMLAYTKSLLPAFVPNRKGDATLGIPDGSIGLLLNCRHDLALPITIAARETRGRKSLSGHCMHFVDGYGSHEAMVGGNDDPLILSLTRLCLSI